VTSMMRAFLLWIALLCAPFASPQAQSEQGNKVEVTVKKLMKNEQPMFEVNATGFARAAQRQAWEVLTDYERLHEFVPDLRSSTLLSRNGQEVIVEQHSESGFLFLTQKIRMVVRVIEQPYSNIDVALVAGDMRSYSAHWELAPSTQNGIAGTRILFSGVMEPDFFVPPLVGRSIVQVNVRRMVEAVLSEIDKRSVEK
jgi:ribosome-associated toxin RatA of RatAB toxin-antitoxin module